MRFIRLKETVLSRLYKWGIANDPPVEPERFTEACFIERFGRKRQSRPKQIFMTLAYLSSRSVKICVNPWLMNYLRAYKALYNCRGLSTTIEDSLQIRPFMQNKANFRKSQMNVNKVLTVDYENKTLGGSGKNKPNTNPIQTQSNPIKANKMPKQSQNEPKQTQFQRANFKSMNNQSSIGPFADPLLPRLTPGSRESISLRSNFTPGKYANAAEGTIRSILLSVENTKKLTIDKHIKMSENPSGVCKFVITS